MQTEPRLLVNLLVILVNVLVIYHQFTRLGGAMGPWATLLNPFGVRGPGGHGL